MTREITILQFLFSSFEALNCNKSGKKISILINQNNF